MDHLMCLGTEQDQIVQVGASLGILDQRDDVVDDGARYDAMVDTPLIDIHAMASVLDHIVQGCPLFRVVKASPCSVPMVPVVLLVASLGHRALLALVVDASTDGTDTFEHTIISRAKEKAMRMHDSVLCVDDTIIAWISCPERWTLAENCRGIARKLLGIC